MCLQCVYSLFALCLQCVSSNVLALCCLQCVVCSVLFAVCCLKGLFIGLFIGLLALPFVCYLQYVVCGGLFFFSFFSPLQKDPPHKAHHHFLPSYDSRMGRGESPTAKNCRGKAERVRQDSEKWRGGEGGGAFPTAK